MAESISDKPQTIDDYKTWLDDSHSVEVTRKTTAHFEAVAHKVRDTFQGSPFWQSVVTNLRDVHDRYTLATEYPLFVTAAQAPALVLKPFDSFLLKTFRSNVIDNDQWPEPPPGGWMLPYTCFSDVKDIVRTRFFVKYLDGVEFLLDKLVALANDSGLRSETKYVGGTDGYYAAHLHVTLDFEIPKPDFDTETRPITVELQITSQLQEVIRRLLHHHFERQRQRPPESRYDWQWNYRSDEFATNYLGHILHYVEGMIMEVRDRAAKAGRERT